MSYRHLDHSTDAIIEVTAPDLTSAFEVAGMSVVETIIDSSKIDERDKRTISVTGQDLRFLLYNWLEEVIILTITDGFAGKRILLQISEAEEWEITAEIFGEDVNLSKHGFKVEIKSPTFHDMRIEQNGNVVMRYLLDL